MQTLQFELVLLIFDIFSYNVSELTDVSRTRNAFCLSGTLATNLDLERQVFSCRSYFVGFLRKETVIV